MPDNINLEEWELAGNSYEECVLIHDPCGYAVFPKNMREAIVKIQEHMESGCSQ